MTKSGIGTSGISQPPLSNQTSTHNLTNNSSIGSAEIPIWVADRKKWVTGISKKTTVNDLIYAILKQCQLVPDASQNESSQTIIEQIASQYVLTEYQYEPSNESTDPEYLLSSQRILDGDSKVYKYLPKWSQITNTNNLMLKILQRELVTDIGGENTSAPVHHHTHHSLASKILKKIGVNSNSNLNKNLTVHAQTQQSTGPSSYRFVDVKLPNSKCVPLTLKANETNNSDTHRALLYNTIIERENRLKKQKDKFSLLDELLRESEKKTKVVYESYNSLPNNYNPNTNTNTNVVDLNDIYCHFPEMCTHNINEVEDFTYMCCQLFKLDEAIQSQKHILNNLELDLQRELNNQNQFGTLLSQNMMTSDCPEVVELRKEVNNSREQTRIQCKQLHDLDLRMRQNEQNLMLKEQELNQLLEQLYVQEVYTENAQEPKLNQCEHVNVNELMSEDFDRINLDNDEVRTNYNDDMILANNLISKSTNGMSSRSTNNLSTQLNNAHKSLSYGNLNAPVLQTSPNQVLQKSQIVNQKMKTSPSMDINNKNLVINTNDQLGETDSGISSMSSETAVTTTTSSTSSTSSTQIINSNNSPNSIPINNLYFNGQKQAVVVPNQFNYQLNQQQFQYQQLQQQQRQYMQQQVQQQKQPPQLPMNGQSLGTSLAASTKQVKSVLETLV